MTIQDVITEAASRGLTGLPEPSRLTDVRVWPAGPEWVAEVGSVPHNEPVPPGLYKSKDEAVSVGLAAVKAAREQLAAILPADLAESVNSLPEPTVNVFES